MQRGRGVTCHAADHAKGICFAGFDEALESQFPKIAESQPEVLAHHCAKAGQTEKVSLQLGRAGQQSFARWAMREAAEQLSRVLGQIATLPGTAALRGEQIKLKVALANALAHLKGYAAPETRTSLDRARSLIERAEALAVETNDQPKDGRTSGLTPRSLKRSASASSAVKASGPSVPIPRCRPEFCQLSWTGTEVLLQLMFPAFGPRPDIAIGRSPRDHCRRDEAS